MDYLTIGQLARRVGVHVDTIRYYERRGLLPRSSRRPSGYRQFTDDAVKRIVFIKHAQAVGFTLKEIVELLSLRIEPDTTCADIRGRVGTKIDEVEKKIEALRRMHKALTRLKSACRGKGPTGECPILEALDSKTKGESLSKG